MISAYRQKGPNHTFYGCYLVCHDINSGVKLWSQEFGYYKSQHQEIVRIMYVADGNLVTINQVNKFPFNKDYTKKYYPDMLLSKKVLNISTGKIISNTQRQYYDTLAYSTIADFGLIFTRNYLYKEKQNIRFITPQHTNKKSYIKSVLLDTTGLLISEDTISFKNLNYFFNFTQIHEDTLISIQFMDNPNSIVFHYLSPRLELYKSVYSPYIFDQLPVKINLVKISEDKTKVLFYNQRNEFYPDDYIEIYVFEIVSGKIIRKIALKETYYFDGMVSNWENESDTLTIYQGLLKQRKQDNAYFSALNVFKVNDLDSIVLFKEYTPTDTLRAGFPYDFVSITESKLIIFFSRIWFNKKSIN